MMHGFKEPRHRRMASSGPAALQATLALFDDEEIPVVSRVGQFVNREKCKRKNKKTDADAGDDKEPEKPVPTTPKTGTTSPEPTTKKDHEKAKKLLRSERLNGADETKRYLFEEPLLESEPEVRQGLGDDGEEEASAEKVGKDCFLGSRG